MSITASVEGDVLLVTLDRPEKRNAMSAAMRDELVELFEGVDARDDVVAVLITGRDPAFSGGVDIKELTAGGGATRRPTSPAAALRAVQRPTVCAINGVCVTGALEIALSADVIIASDRATFADTHVARGLVPAWGMTALLARAIGTVHARDLSLTGRFIDAPEALSMGLVARLVPHEELLSTALDTARALAGMDQGVLRIVRDLTNNSIGLDLDAAFAAETAAVRAWISSRR
jgi:enoyl-CoA hydratase